MQVTCNHQLEVKGTKFNLMAHKHYQIHINKDKIKSRTFHHWEGLGRSGQSQTRYLIVFTPVATQNFCLMCWNHNSDSCCLHVPNPQSLITWWKRKTWSLCITPPACSMTCIHDGKSWETHCFHWEDTVICLSHKYTYCLTIIMHYKIY